MKKQKDHWNELLPYEKKFEVATWVLFGLFFVVFAMEIMTWIKVLILPFALEIPGHLLLGSAQACQAVVYWRKERNVAHACLLAAIVFGLGAVWDIVKLFI